MDPEAREPTEIPYYTQQRLDDPPGIPYYTPADPPYTDEERGQG